MNRFWRQIRSVVYGTRCRFILTPSISAINQKINIAKIRVQVEDKHKGFERGSHKCINI